MKDLSRRKTLLLLGTSTTALGSGCLSSLGLSSGDGSNRTETRTNGQTRSQTTNGTAHTQTRSRTATRTTDRTTQTQTSEPTATRASGPARLRYKKDLRKSAWTSGKPLSSVSGVGGWKATGGSTTSIDWDEAGGNEGVRLVSAESPSHVTMQTTFEKPLDLTKTALSFGLRLTETDAESITIRALAPYNRDRASMQKYTREEYGVVRIDFAPDDVTGSPDLSSVRGLEFAVSTDEQFELDVGALRLRKIPRRKRGSGSVILTFDDGLKTTFHKAKPLMDKLGYKGVVGVIPWTLGDPSKMTTDQIHTLAAEGWEMASHPHPPTPNRGEKLPNLPPSVQRDVIERSKQWLLDEGFPTNGEAFVWPYGAFDDRSLDLITQYHRVAFGGGSAPAPWAITEPAWIPRVKGDEPKEVKRAVDMAAEFGTVATLEYHDIDRNDRISTEEFKKELAYIDKADVDVVLPSELASAQPY